MPKHEKRLAFENTRFILTEGIEDAAFIRKLIRGRNLQTFDVNPIPDLTNSSGNSGFEDGFISCEPITRFDAVTDVVIVADNDENPEASFNNICSQINRAKSSGDIQRDWGVPTQPGQKAVGDPSVSVWMWPAPMEAGCLETLIWRVIQSQYPTEAVCVDTACACNNANKWSISKYDKARVRCFLSIVYKKNPAISLSNLWGESPDFIQITNPALDSICNFLQAI